MTIINPNSISGISSITALNSTAAINLFKADGTSANIIAGVTTGANFITGTSNVHSTGYECTNINASGIITATNVNVGDDLDVTDDLTIGGEFGMQGSFDNNKYFDARIGSSYKLIFRSSSGGPGNLVTMLQLGTTGSSLVGNFSLGDSTDSSSAAGPEFTLNRNSSSPANADYLGQIKFAGRSSTGIQRNYAKITGKILDVTNGAEDGILEFAHIKNGSQVITGRWRSDSLQLLNSTNFSVAGTSEFTGTATGTIFKVPDATNVSGATNHIAVGDNSDLKLYHDNNGDTQIFNSTGHLTIVNNTAGRIINLQPKSGANGVIARYEGAAELYWNNQLKLSTGNNGINVSGSIALGDNGRLYLGSSNDAYLYHDGGNTHFYNQTGHLQIRQAANSDVITQTNAIDRFRIYNDGVVAIGQSSKSSTVGAGNLDIQGNATNCIIEMGNPFPTYSGGVVPEFRITATNSSHTVDFESVWGGDNLLHKHLAFSGGSTRFYRGTNSDEIARFNNADFGIGTQSPGDKLHVNGGDIIISHTNAPNLRLVKADDSTGSNSNRAFFGIASGANNYMNGAADADLCIVGPDGGRILFGYGNSVKLFMESNGRLKSAATYNNTTGSSANVSMPNNTGEFFRSTSSRKYKDNIITLTDAQADKILDCRPVSYTSTCAADDNSKIFYGMIAEEVHEVDTSLVLYDNESETPEPEGVQYDRFVPALVNLVKRQKAQIATLEAKVAALEGA